MTAGNTDDRTPVPQLQQLFGKVFADKGYSRRAGKTTAQNRGIQLIT